MIIVTKHLLYFFATLFLSYAFAQGDQKTKEDKGRYAFESIEIQYNITGDQNGTALLTIMDYGRMEKREEKYTLTLHNMESSQHRLNLRINTEIYEIDMMQGKGRKSQDRITNELLSYKTPEEVHHSLISQRGGTLDRKDTLLGKPVNVWLFEKGTTRELWEWQGIPLKEDKKVGPLTYQISAKSIEMSPTINPDFFEIPDRIVFN